MNNTHDVKLDQELRRHFAGIAQGAIDALHIWCSAQQLLYAAGLDFERDDAQTMWRAVPEHLLTILSQLSEITADPNEPVSIPWYQFRDQLDYQAAQLNGRVAMLLGQPERL